MKISICDDVCATHSAEFFKSRDVNLLFADVPTAFSDSDRVIVNLECALTEKETPIIKKGPNMKGPTETAEVLRSRTLSNGFASITGKRGSYYDIRRL